MKWVLATTAPDQIIAEMWATLLYNHGIPSRLSAGDTSAFLGISIRPCGILVQEDMLESALTVLEGEEVESIDPCTEGEEEESV